MLVQGAYAQTDECRMLGIMTLTDRLNHLDARVLRDRSTPASRAWGARNGWWLFLLLGLVILGVCVWAVAEGRPVIAVMNVGLGGACLVAAGLLWHRARCHGAGSAGADSQKCSPKM